MTRRGTGWPSQTLRAADDRPADRLLKAAARYYAAAFLLHTGDHLRRGVDAVTPEVFWAGMVASVVAMVAIVLVLSGHRLAPQIAVMAGFPLALGYAAVHLAPRWSAFSDPFPGGGVDAVSWAAALIEIAGAFALGATGAYALRCGGRLQDGEQGSDAQSLPDSPGHGETEQHEREVRRGAPPADTHAIRTARGSSIGARLPAFRVS